MRSLSYSNAWTLMAIVIWKVALAKRTLPTLAVQTTLWGQMEPVASSLIKAMELQAPISHGSRTLSSLTV